jgi:hypothetical protein
MPNLESTKPEAIVVCSKSHIGQSFKIWGGRGGGTL